MAEARDIASSRSPLRELLSYGIPSLVGYLVLSVNELVDMFWLGRVGTESVAAVTIAATLLWVLLEFPGVSVGSGSVAVISRRFGEGNVERTVQAIRATFMAKIYLGTIFCVFGLLTMNWTLNFLGAEPGVLAMAAGYTLVLVIASPLLHASFSVFTVLRSIGKPKWAFWMQAVGVGINLVLDPLLIFGIGPFPQWGVFGAAVATAISFVTVVILGGALLASERSPIRVHWFRRPYPGLSEMWSILRIGWPTGIGSLSLGLASSAAVKFVAEYGTDVVAIFGLGHRALEFGLTAMAGFGLGGSALIGQHLGAKAQDRAWETGKLNVGIPFLMMLAFCLVLIAAASPIVSSFLPDVADPESGANLLRILALGLPVMGMVTGVTTVFSGAGMNKPTMVLSFAEAWVLMIPLMYFGGHVLDYGPVGLMWGRTIAFFISGIAALWLFQRRAWIRHEV